MYSPSLIFERHCFIKDVRIKSGICRIIEGMLFDNVADKAIQKEIVTKSPLIDWVWLLILIAISLASEWFVRKYNGML